LQDSVSLPHLREADQLQALELDELAARAALGDRAAFERIYNLLVDDLYSYIRGQCRNETVAEDLVANVFLKAWRSAKGYRPSSHTFRRWIFTIARNEVRDFWRASQRTLPMVEFDISDERQPEPETDPVEVRRLVQQALATLTEEQRQVVVLRYFSNKSHEEIATILGKREGAVRAQLMRALRQMRKVMGDATP
jgi:RNA polymerase sigma-70 factor (ECF subfamily)